MAIGASNRVEGLGAEGQGDGDGREGRVGGRREGQEAREGKVHNEGKELLHSARLGVAEAVRTIVAQFAVCFKF